MAGVRAQLSPSEETTFRRIALGILGPSDVREADAKRLTALGLILAVDSLLIPTRRGLKRIKMKSRRQEPSPVEPPGQRRMKARRLPF